MSETDVKTSYTYDVLDRLVEAKELNGSQAILKTYDYDKRGNQKKEFINGFLQKTYTFDATNMLSKVVDKDKGELENLYNGLGFRVASVKPEERIEYLCDLSRDCYNLLERTVNGETESFVYDNNVISMSKGGNNFYYLQDELGSPMYMTGTDGAAVSAYAFDDFGRNIDPFTGKQKKLGYTKQGNIIQPFAFTGYQEDEISGLKFAQARFYSADNGRFQSEDNVKGIIDNPVTLNHYGYCFGNPVLLVDNDGNWAKCIANAANKVVAGAKTCVNTASNFINDNKESIGAVISVAGLVGGTIVSCLGNPVLGGAIMGGATQLGEAVAKKGTHLDGKDALRVVVGAAAGAVGGKVGTLWEKGPTLGKHVVRAVLNTAVDVGEELGYEFIDEGINRKKIISTGIKSIVKNASFEGICALANVGVKKLKLKKAAPFDEELDIDEEIGKVQGKIASEVESIAIHENYKLNSSGPESKMFKGAENSIKYSKKRIAGYFDQIQVIKNFGKWNEIGKFIKNKIVGAIFVDCFLRRFGNWENAYMNFNYQESECMG